MSPAANGRRAFISPWVWVSLAVFGIGTCIVSNQARFWLSSYASTSSRVVFFLLEGLAVATASGLFLGVISWSMARLFRVPGRDPLIIGSALGFNLAIIALFWIMPAFI